MSKDNVYVLGVQSGTTFLLENPTSLSGGTTKCNRIYQKLNEKEWKETYPQKAYLEEAPKKIENSVALGYIAISETAAEKKKQEKHKVWNAMLAKHGLEPYYKEEE